MSAKRQHHDSDDDDAVQRKKTKAAESTTALENRQMQQRSNQKQKPAERPKQKESRKLYQYQLPTTDPTWGQKYVFGADDVTTIPRGQEEDFEDDSDAMAYLKSVRQEAHLIPHVLVAPKVQIGPQLPDDFEIARSNDDEHEEGEVDDNIPPTSRGSGGGDMTIDSRGYYEDGAYIGRPEDSEKDGGDGGEIPEQDRKSQALHKAYFGSIMDQYLSLRVTLHSELPDNAAGQLTKSQPTFAAFLGPHSPTVKIWSTLVHNNNPHPIQIALMSKDSVLRVLRVILGGKFLRRGCPIAERTSTWLWALLARLPDKGELNHCEIGLVRDLGRRAVLVSRSLEEMAALREELANTGSGVNDVDASTDESVMAEVVVEEGEEGVENWDAEADIPESSTAAPADGRVDRKDSEVGAIDLDDMTTDADATVPDSSTAPATADPSNVNQRQDGLEEGEVGMDDATTDAKADVPDSSAALATPDRLDKDRDEEDAEVGSEEGEVNLSDYDSDVSMDIESDSEEVNDLAELEEAKKALLSRIDDAQAEQQRRKAESDRERMNTMASLNMILTIVGEFYGQRDLLEFREPFVEISETATQDT